MEKPTLGPLFQKIDFLRMADRVMAQALERSALLAEARDGPPLGGSYYARDAISEIVEQRGLVALSVTLSTVSVEIDQADIPIDSERPWETIRGTRTMLTVAVPGSRMLFEAQPSQASADPPIANINLQRGSVIAVLEEAPELSPVSVLQDKRDEFLGLLVKWTDWLRSDVETFNERLSAELGQVLNQGSSLRRAEAALNIPTSKPGERARAEPSEEEAKGRSGRWRRRQRR
jgi:hypothetical protein